MFELAAKGLGSSKISTMLKEKVLTRGWVSDTLRSRAVLGEWFRNDQKAARLVPQPSERFAIHLLDSVNSTNADHFGLTPEFEKRKSLCS
jgi:hypothetical protein